VGTGNIRIAVATGKNGGLDDRVSDVFGRADTFTLIDVDEGQIKNVKILKNPAVSYEHGAGPIVVKTLVDLGVNIVIGSELGPGALALIKQHNISMVKVNRGTLVSDAIKKVGLELRGRVKIQKKN
jgi:predicted Fe-Mo cluster-binding NifX family protein